MGRVCVSGWEVFVLLAGDEPEGFSCVLGEMGSAVGEVEIGDSIGIVRKFRTVQQEGKRMIDRDLEHCHLKLLIINT